MRKEAIWSIVSEEAKLKKDTIDVNELKQLNSEKRDVAKSIEYLLKKKKITWE